MAETTDPDQLLAEARRAWEAYIQSGTDEDYVAARNATTATRKAGISLAEIHTEEPPAAKENNQ